MWSVTSPSPRLPSPSRWWVCRARSIRPAFNRLIEWTPQADKWIKMGATVRINAPHIETESWASSVSGCGMLSPPELCCVLLRVTLRRHIGEETCRNSWPQVAFRSLGLGSSCCVRVKPLWEEVGQIHSVCGTHATRRDLFSPLLPHTLFPDGSLNSLRGPNWDLIRIWWWNSTPPAADIPTCVIPNWTFGLSWLASKGWTLWRLCLCTPRNTVFTHTERRSSVKTQLTKLASPPLKPIVLPYQKLPYVATASIRADWSSCAQAKWTTTTRLLKTNPILGVICASDPHPPPCAD